MASRIDERTGAWMPDDDDDDDGTSDDGDEDDRMSDHDDDDNDDDITVVLLDCIKIFHLRPTILSAVTPSENNWTVLRNFLNTFSIFVLLCFI